jgi:ribonuclease HI
MIYRAGRTTVDGGGLLPWQARTVALYGDGGCIQANPSPYGGTWAWCAVDRDGWMIHSEYGWFTPPHLIEGGYQKDGVLCAENNQSEFLAILLALRSLKTYDVEWVGKMYTDNLMTIRRWTQGAPLKNIPYVWRQSMGEILRMPGYVGNPDNWTLLDGHPSKKQLAAGFGKRGNPVSIHNYTCDELCHRAAIRAVHPGTARIEVIDMNRLDNLDTQTEAV